MAGAGPTAFSLYSAALLQMPQLKVLSLHNTTFFKDDVPNIAACVPGLRELHVSGWLHAADVPSHLVFAPILTRKMIRGLVGLQHLQCLRLTICARPSYAPPQSPPLKAAGSGTWVIRSPDAGQTKECGQGCGSKCGQKQTLRSSY